jgi:hypothetical protein
LEKEKEILNDNMKELRQILKLSNNDAIQITFNEASAITPTARAILQDIS